MSKYVIYYSCRKEMYRELAQRWMKWSTTTNLTDDQIRGVSMFFRSIAVRFGLIKEFREIGVIS
jgi:hypothetical protein